MLCFNKVSFFSISKTRKNMEKLEKLGKIPTPLDFLRDWNGKVVRYVWGRGRGGTNRFVLIVRHVRLSRREEREEEGGGGRRRARKKERSVRPYRQQTTRLFLERSGVRYTIIMTRDEPWTCPTISGAAYETATPRGCLLHTASLCTRLCH